MRKKILHKKKQCKSAVVKVNTLIFDHYVAIIADQEKEIEALKEQISIYEKLTEALQSNSADRDMVIENLELMNAILKERLEIYDRGFERIERLSS